MQPEGQEVFLLEPAYYLYMSGFLAELPTLCTVCIPSGRINVHQTLGSWTWLGKGQNVIDIASTSFWKLCDMRCRKSFGGIDAGLQHEAWTSNSVSSRTLHVELSIPGAMCRLPTAYYIDSQDQHANVTASRARPEETSRKHPSNRAREPMHPKMKTNHQLTNA